MTIPKFIENAIKGGWKPHFLAGQAVQEIGDVYAPALIHPVVLDPLAWQAVGKVEGNKVCICGTQGTLHTQQCPCAPVKAHATHQMHRMIDALAEGKTIEQYLETL